jgi:hypothetical protein
MSTQKQQVLAHLKKHKKITSWEAIQKYNITRLAAHIFELGMTHQIASIRTTDKVSGKWYAIYKYLGEKK